MKILQYIFTSYRTWETLYRASLQTQRGADVLRLPDRHTAMEWI